MVFGIEPSKKAVAEAVKRGVVAVQGTADFLPYENKSFDILIFGFCLYLCDQHDLFKIAHEADRVLKDDAWLIINDFYYPGSVARDYHHKPGVQSHKMDYRKLFEWHPSYVCYSHQLQQHGLHEFCDDPQEWVSVSTMRKGSFGNV
jgi:ubiquinone/menaquinone biosynthesis C-methylase UbiE